MVAAATISDNPGPDDCRVAARETSNWHRRAGWEEPGPVTIADHVRYLFPDGQWRGDACGCTDDCCIGFHHDTYAECGCLPALLDQYHVEMLATCWTAS